MNNQLISVQEAEHLISEYVLTDQIESVSSIEDPQQCLSAEPIVADREYPPFHRVAMDGIAISFSAFQQGRTRFRIQSCQQAGDKPHRLESEDDCIEVMTGCALPSGCDTVVRYEDLEIVDQIAVLSSQVTSVIGQNVHHRGSDYAQGHVLIPKNTIMRAPHWATAASVGHADLRILRSKRIALVGTGNELVSVRSTPQAHQIRMSNVHAIKASLIGTGIKDIECVHLNDNKSEIFTVLERLLHTCDVLILSGGVSAGKFDFIPECLNDLKVRKVFHKINQRPGKPMWFGVSEKDQPIFGLPGNPVSALVCLHRYIMPHFKPQKKWYAQLTEDFEFKKNLVYFLPVKVFIDNQARVCATPIRVNGSGDFASLSKSDGFLQLEAEKTNFYKGTPFPLYRW